MERRVTTQDVSWFLDLYHQDQLDLDPAYQRRSVWNPKDRRFFLDTIFRGYPSPSIFLNKVIDDSGKTVYAVVDGKQRLETIFNFVKNKIYIDKNYGDVRLDGKRWKDLQEHNDLKMKFWNYVLPVEFINITDDPTLLVKQVFDRLNRSSSKLVEQELRHAKYDGWFITFIEDEIINDIWTALRVYTRARAKRMKDVQFLSELLLVVLKQDVQGFDQEALNEAYAYYDVLDEPDNEIEVDDFVAIFNFVRDFLYKVENHNQVVSTYSRDFKDFYSLWSVAVLHHDRLNNAANFADKYLAFMQQVDLLRKYESLETQGRDQGQVFSPEIVKYYQNSIGANTEFPQRKARYEALAAAIIEI
ncbi:MAG: DUF262 domain-containing protein [Desulfobulbaceae bacterium]